MIFLYGAFSFLFGLAIGSFLNVVIIRYNAGRSVRGRSSCPFCSKTLSWKELIPLVSFIVQRGKCISCKNTISLQYPLVEFVTGLFFLFIHLKFFVGVFDISYLLPTTYYLLIISLLVIIAVYDYYHKIIPNVFVYALIVISGLYLFIDTSIGGLITVPSFWYILAGPILFSPFALLWLASGIDWRKRSFSIENSGQWMGFGDAKLAWAIGWLLGLSNGISAIVFAFWIGATYFLVLLGVQKVVPFTQQHKRLKMNSEVPFGPFLIIGFLLVFFTGIDVLSLVSLFVT